MKHVIVHKSRVSAWAESPMAVAVDGDAHPNFSFYHVVYPVDEVLANRFYKLWTLRL